MDGNDYYEILQIQPTASQEEVKAAYKRLALLNHPDLSRDPQATLRMQALNAAYAVVGSQEKRAQYDQVRLGAESPEKAEPGHPSSTQPVSPVQKEPDHPPQEQARKEPDPRLYRWMRHQLRLFVWIMGLTMLLFVVSIITGRVSPLAVLMLVLLSVFVIASMVTKIRRPVARSRKGSG